MPQSKDNNDHAIPGNYADLDYSGIHQFVEEAGDIEGECYGSFEVFIGRKYYDKINAIIDEIDLDAWYWWSCFPGCLPDSDPIGPFGTSADAYHNAQGY